MAKKKPTRRRCAPPWPATRRCRADTAAPGTGPRPAYAWARAARRRPPLPDGDAGRALPGHRAHPGPLCRPRSPSPTPIACRATTNADLSDLLRRVSSPSPVYKDMEEVMAADDFERLRAGLGASDPLVQAVLQGRTPEAVAAFYLQGTHLDDVAVRKELMAEKGKGRCGAATTRCWRSRVGWTRSCARTEKAFRENVRAVEEEAGDPDRPGPLRRLRRQAVSRRHRHAALRLRQGGRLPVGHDPRAALHDLVRPLRPGLRFGDQGDFALTAAAARATRPARPGRQARTWSAPPTSPAATPAARSWTATGSWWAWPSTATRRATPTASSTARPRRAASAWTFGAILQALAKLYDAQPLVDELLAAVK